MTIRVLIIDDSTVMQGVLTALIELQTDLKVVGTANDAFEAREQIKLLKPDVVTLDVEMPKMDGITFLEKLMRLHPMPVVMVSSLTLKNADVTLRALELGAIDFITKPQIADRSELTEFAAALCEKLRTAANTAPRFMRPAIPLSRLAEKTFRPSAVIAIGASTGGTEAIREILERFPANAPPIVIAQHMPEMYTQSFAKRLNDLCAITVFEASHGQILKQGHAYIAPGGKHLRIRRLGRQLETVVDETEKINRHRPSVDALFHSVAETVGADAVGVLLTGMGNDGAEGLGAMHRTGAFTIAQDEQSCVVFGMPKVAIEAGYVDCVASIKGVAGKVLEVVQM